MLSFSVLVLAGCGQDPEPVITATAVPVPATTQADIEPTPVATPVPAPDKPEVSPATSSGPPPTPAVVEQPPQPSATPASMVTTSPAGAVPSPTSVATSSTAPQPESTPVPVNTPTPPFLDLLFPQDGSILEVAAVRVFGNTQNGAAVTVNGAPVEVQANGSFQSDLALDVGLNTINVVVTDQLGRSDSRSAAVFVVPAADPLPFNVFYPRDGIDVGQRDLPVSGVTKPDAVVLVNGISVEVNALGIYSAVVVLEDDTNLIEVVATDIFGNLRSQTIAVFYTP